MVSSRVHVPISHTVINKHRKSRLLANHLPTQKVVDVNIWEDGTRPFHPPQFPIVEPYIVTDHKQCWSHDCLVLLEHAGQEHKFKVFFRRHVRLEVNRHVQYSNEVAKKFVGDILVMRVAKRSNLEFVHCRAGDADLVDHILTRSSEWLGVKSPIKLPEYLVLTTFAVARRSVRTRQVSCRLNGFVRS